MASEVVRRLLNATGGLTVGATTLSEAGKLSTGSLNITSGSTTICASGMAVGGGTNFGTLIYGQGKVTLPQTIAASTGRVLITVASLLTTDTVIVTTGSMPASVVFTGASPTAASVLTIWYANWGTGTMTATPISYQYLILR